MMVISMVLDSSFRGTVLEQSPEVKIVVTAGSIVQVVVSGG